MQQHLIGLKDAIKGVVLNWLLNEFVGGSQLTITILAAYLATIPNLDKKTVFLQLDNCTAENKNWLVLQFLSVLVGMGKVLCVFLNFLPVGHTHIDIDQVRTSSLFLSKAFNQQTQLIN